MLAHERAKIEQIAQNLSVNEKFVVLHRDARLEAEVAWHESLLERLPEILADEKKRQKENRR
jgi:hypothetical protein